MQRNLLDRTFDYIVYLCLFLTPLIFVPSLNLVFALPKVIFFRICLMLMLGVFALKIVKKPKLEILSVFLRRDVKRLLLGFLLFVTFGVVASMAPALSFWGSYYRLMGGLMYFHLFLFFLLLVLNFHSAEQWKKAIQIFIAGITVVFLYAFIQLFGIDFSGLGFLETASGRVSSTFGHPSYLGGYIVLVWFSVLAYYLANRKWWLLLVLGYLGF